MDRTCRWAMVLAMGIASASYAGAPAADQDLAAKVSNLQSLVQSQAKEIQSLRSAMGDNWLNERRAEEVKSLVREVLSDADTRASLLEGGMSAGHKDGHFYLGSDDGSFLLQVSGLIQVRYVYNHRNMSESAPGTVGGNVGIVDGSSTDEDEMGFELSRAKLLFEGHIVSPQWGYAVGIMSNVSDTADNDIMLDRAYIAWRPCDGWEIWGGLRKAPGLREEMVEPGMQLAVDRSIVNEYYTLGRVQGAGLIWNTIEPLRVQFAIHNGANSGEGGDRKFDRDLVDYALTARADYKVMGDWKQWDDFSAWSGEDTALFLGAGVTWQDYETGDVALAAAVATRHALQVTADLSYESNGLSLYLAGVGRYLNIDDYANVTWGTDSGDKHSYGFIAQAGYMIIPDTLEPFVRYELIATDDASNRNNVVYGNASPSDDLQALTVGANYYFARHAAKFTLDVVWVMEPLDATTTGGGFRSLGLLGDDLDAQDQIAVRAQMQLAF